MSRVSKGFLWSSLDRFSVQGVSFLLSIIIARIISPESYGLIVMVQVFMSICQTFIDGGFANALIHKQNRTEVDYYTAFIFNMSVAIVLYFLLFICAPFIASFYNEFQLISITRVIGLNLIFTSLSIVQRTRLTIDLDFKTQAKAGLVSVCISGGIGILCAYKGLEVWALVVQGLVNSALTSVLLMTFARWFPRFDFSMKSFKELFNFGSKLLLTNLITNIYLNIYNLVIGKRFSSASLAYYNRAFTLTQIPSTNIEMVLSRIIYPIECELQDDKYALKKAYFKYLHFSNFIVLPLLFLLISVAEPLVRVVLTDKWLPAVPYIILFSLSFTLYPWLDQSVQLLNVLGQTGINLKTQILKRIVSFGILVVTIPFGIKTICLGILINTVIELIITLFTDKYVFGIGVMQQVKSQLNLYFICILSSIGGYIVTLQFENIYVQLALGGLAFIFSYIILSFLFNVEEIKIIQRKVSQIWHF